MVTRAPPTQGEPNCSAARSPARAEARASSMAACARRVDRSSRAARAAPTSSPRFKTAARTRRLRGSDAKPSLAPTPAKVASRSTGSAPTYDLRRAGASRVALRRAARRACVRDERAAASCAFPAATRAASAARLVRARRSARARRRGRRATAYPRARARAPAVERAAPRAGSEGAAHGVHPKCKASVTLPSRRRRRAESRPVRRCLRRTSRQVHRADDHVPAHSPRTRKGPAGRAYEAGQQRRGAIRAAAAWTGKHACPERRTVDAAARCSRADGTADEPRMRLAHARAGRERCPPDAPGTPVHTGMLARFPRGRARRFQKRSRVQARTGREAEKEVSRDRVTGSL